MRLQQKSILAFSPSKSQAKLPPAGLPGFEHLAEVRRERKRAEARAYLGAAAGEPTPKRCFISTGGTRSEEYGKTRSHAA